jgi:DNA repair exonuclease SbcCD nuclease subunit
MRILQISDTHLGAKLNARGPQGWSRADDHFDALVHALQPAFREEVDLVVHAGDVFDRSRPPRRDVERSAALFHDVARRVPVVGIAGNHDRKGIQRWLPHRSLRFVDQPQVVEHGGRRFGLVPFQRYASHFAAAVARLLASGPLDLLFCHASFAGSRVPGFTFRVAPPQSRRHTDVIGLQHLLEAGVDPMAVGAIGSGHIHPRQALQLGPIPVVHGGSTERTAFSEASQVKGTVIWDLSGPSPAWRFADHPTRPMAGSPRDARPGALVRCGPDDVPAVRKAGAIAVVRARR